LIKFGTRAEPYHVGREVGTGRERACQAGLSSLDQDKSPDAEYVRQKFMSLLANRQALQAARRGIYAMRANDEIGDDAFRSVEQELDWLEMALGADVRQGLPTVDSV
jgi:hypothetical protein